MYPSGSPVKFLKLCFRGDMSFVERVFGDAWERSGDKIPLEWRSVMAWRILPWYCYVSGAGRTACYGVKTQPNAFAFFQVDTHGITLFLNLTCGADGTDLKEPIAACEVVELVGEEGEDAYKVACRFAPMMCENPRLPKEPVFGVNNWYWAYGNISRESVRKETDYLLEMTSETKHRPYMILDDGWQFNRSTNPNSPFIGGPWEANERFGSMKETADEIHEKGAKAGIWFRPMLTLGALPNEAVLAAESGGFVLDPSHPYTIERIERDAAKIRAWGYDLIKHDFSFTDITGEVPHFRTGAKMGAPNRHLFDRSRTTAMLMKDVCRAIAHGGKDAEVIGCSVSGHLAAGIHSIIRVGDDTSGRSFEWTVRNGVNSVMRLPLHNSLYVADPDCAAFTEQVDPEMNLDFMEVCALTGMTTLASVTPHILTAEQMKRIRKIYALADRDEDRYQILDFDRNALPERFISADGKTVKEYDWSRAYNGARSLISWLY